MTPEQSELVGALTLLRDNLKAPPDGLVYRLGWDFVLQHGKLYEPRPYPAEFPSGPPKMCFAWSIVQSILLGWKYVEGYAMMPLPFQRYPFAHAWNIDKAGNLVDSTWDNEGSAYIGVEFSPERADDAMWNGNCHTLDDWHRDWPIFQQRWNGEPADKVWPPSPRLEFLRSGDAEGFNKYMLEQQEAIDDSRSTATVSPAALHSWTVLRSAGYVTGSREETLEGNI